MKKVLLLWMAYVLLFAATAFAQSTIIPDSYSAPKVEYKEKDGKWFSLETKTNWTAGRTAENPVVVTIPQDISIKNGDKIKVYLNVRNRNFHMMIVNSAAFYGNNFFAFKPLSSDYVGAHATRKIQLTFDPAEVCKKFECIFSSEGLLTLFYIYEKADYMGVPYLPSSRINAHYKFIR